MKIVVLLENTACDESLACEHGLSLYIEANGKKILFDAGQSSAFADNAKKLGIDLSAVDFCILSHGHYDHGGGLGRFLEMNKTARVYASPEAFGRHYHGKEKYIGLDQTLPRERFVPVAERMDLAPGITIDPCNERTENVGAQGMFVVQDGKWEPEAFRHEQYLLITEGKKRYCFSGCSHRGVGNIVNWFRPEVFIGGFHLSKVEEETVIISTAEALATSDTAYYTGHCTGEKQFALMKQVLGARLSYLSTGTVIG